MGGGRSGQGNAGAVRGHTVDAASGDFAFPLLGCDFTWEDCAGGGRVLSASRVCAEQQASSPAWVGLRGAQESPGAFVRMRVRISP